MKIKKRISIPTVTTTVVSIALITLLVGCGKSETPIVVKATATTTAAAATTGSATSSPVTSKAPKAPEAVKSNGVSVEVVKWGDAAVPEDLQLANGKKAVYATLTIKNDSSDYLKYSPVNFSVKSSDGVMNPAEVLITVENLLTPATLAPGGKITGSLGFVVPTDMSSGVLVFEQNGKYTEVGQLKN